MCLYKEKKSQNKKPALYKRKQQLVTCIQLATEHIRDQKMDTSPKKEGMFTASSQRIKSSMTGGLEAGISSQNPEKYKQCNMKWTDLMHFKWRWGFGRQRVCIRAFPLNFS